MLLTLGPCSPGFPGGQMQGAAVEPTSLGPLRHWKRRRHTTRQDAHTRVYTPRSKMHAHVYTHHMARCVHTCTHTCVSVCVKQWRQLTFTSQSNKKFSITQTSYEYQIHSNHIEMDSISLIYLQLMEEAKQSHHANITIRRIIVPRPTSPFWKKNNNKHVFRTCFELNF